ncbi:MAG: hypothetical protein ACRC6L_07880 [Steroidobacteraceae bacterium]
MTAQPRFPTWLPIAASLFAAAHLAFEHFTGGVQSHHLLARSDLPSFSNWFGLAILPLLGVVLGLRLRAQPASAGPAGIPPAILVAFAVALLYGAALAVSFELGPNAFTSVAFFGLFVCALAFPVYRAEYILGFVVGMTFTFGSVLPLLIALVVGTVSLVARYCFRTAARVIRGRRVP